MAQVSITPNTPVACLLPNEVPGKMPSPNRFPVVDLVELHGSSTVSELATQVETVVLLRCGKLHEEAFSPFDSCPNFTSNLLCGHCNALREGRGRLANLKSASSLVATAMRVLHTAELLPDLATLLEELYQLGSRLYSIDGGAFMAYREILHPGYYSYAFIPPGYRRPKWEKLSLPELRKVIKEAEGELEPEAQRLLDVARGGLRQLTAQ